MTKIIKDYIDNLNYKDIPWHRMFTVSGTAENYGELLSNLEQAHDVEDWKETYYKISDFEHQSTMCPPAPFVLFFLVRILEKLLDSNTKSDNKIAEILINQFIYYAEVCTDAENEKHSQPLDNFSDMLNEKYLLSEEVTEDELDEIYENPDAVPEDLFYSFYHYSKIVLSQVPDILDKSGKYLNECRKLKGMFGFTYFSCLHMQSIAVFIHFCIADACINDKTA